jgi:hypothetical protein
MLQTKEKKIDNLIQAREHEWEPIVHNLLPLSANCKLPKTFPSRCMSPTACHPQPRLQTMVPGRF